MKKQNKNILIWTTLGILVLLFGSGLFAITGLNYLQIHNQNTGDYPPVTNTVPFGDYSLILTTNSFDPIVNNAPIKLNGQNTGKISLSNSYSSSLTTTSFTAKASASGGTGVNNDYVIGRIDNFEGNLTGSYQLYDNGGDSTDSFSYINIYVNGVQKFSDSNEFIGNAAGFANEKDGNIKISVNDPSTVEVVVLASPDRYSSASSSATLNIPPKAVVITPTPNPNPSPTPNPNPNPTPTPTPTPDNPSGLDMFTIVIIIVGITLFSLIVLFVKNRRK